MMNRLEEALENFDVAIQKNPENAENYTIKALTLQKMNRFEEALKFIENSIQIDSGNS